MKARLLIVEWSTLLHPTYLITCFQNLPVASAQVLDIVFTQILCMVREETTEQSGELIGF